MEGQEKLVLVFKMVIDDSGAVFDLGSNLADAGVFIAFGEENFPGGIENQVFNTFSFSFFSFGDAHFEQLFIIKRCKYIEQCSITKRCSINFFGGMNFWGG